MTISDNNLCTLLDMTKRAETAKNLLSQLPSVLCSSYRHSTSLEEVLTSNNEGLPVDIWEEYSRSKKPKITNVQSNGEPSDDVPPLASKEYVEDILDSMKRNGASNESSTTPVVLAASTSPASSTAPASTTPAASTKPASTPAEVVKVLSQSPHIIMCCPNNGTMSYILTVPTPEGPKSITLPRIERPSSGSPQPMERSPVSGGHGGSFLRPKVQAERPSSSGNAPLARLQPERSPVSGGGGGRQGANMLLPKIQPEMPSSSSSSSGGGADGEPGGSPMTRQSSGKGRKSRRTSNSKKGKEKAVEEQPTLDMLQSIQTAISSLLNPTTPDIGTGQSSSSLSYGSLEELCHSMEATPSLMEATPNPMEDTPIPTVTGGVPLSISLQDYDPEKFSKFADFLVKMDPIERNPVEDDTTTSRSSRTSSFRSTESDPTTDGTGLGHAPSSGLSATMSSESQVTVTTIAQSSSNDEVPCSEDDDSIALRIPEVPMSWFCSGPHAEPLGVDGGLRSEYLFTPSNRQDTSGANENSTLMDVDFGLDLNSDSWQQLLEGSLESPIKERHQVHPGFSDTGYSQFVDNLEASDDVQVSDPPLPADVSNSGRRRTIPATGSDSWNGMWHNSNPDSIKNWLKSSFPLGKTAGVQC